MKINLALLLKELLIPALGMDMPAGCPPDLEIGHVTEDSRRCTPETLFVAAKGTRVDGHEFLPNAAGLGCQVALVGRDDVAAPEGMVLIPVEKPRQALALIAQALAGDPSRQMKVLAVTGTNGKTTVTYILESIFRAAGLKPGVIGTINYRWEGHCEPAPQTTPSAEQLANTLAAMKNDGVQAVAMEISSHAIDQHRIDGIHLQSAALTNLTQDHLDYHKTMALYEKAKFRLFSEVMQTNPEAIAVLNVDDASGQRFAANLPADHTLRYSMNKADALLHITNILFSRRGMKLDVALQGKSIQIELPLHGMYNAMNALTAIGLAVSAGIPMDAVAEGLRTMKGVPGRFEFVEAGQPFPIIVDYAHTPDSLTQTMIQAQGFASRKLIVVFGCGGDRDTGKRALMGQAAAQLADEIIVTNDNPRTEDPEAISEAILEGIRRPEHTQAKYCVILDRGDAIRHALGLATKNDAVLIAGKGHEDYQIHGDKRIHFDDREVARAALTR